MLDESLEPEYESVSAFCFWQPPRRYKIPQAPVGRVYIPLVEGCCATKYSPRSLATYPGLAERIPDEAFRKIIESANTVIKTPSFKYRLIRGLLIALIINSIIRLISGVLTDSYIDILIYGIFLIYSPALMRLGGGQYLQRMKRYEKVLNKALRDQVHVRLNGTGMNVKAGCMCLWLDFYEDANIPQVVYNQQGVYTPPAVVGYEQPVYYGPGSGLPVVSK